MVQESTCGQVSVRDPGVSLREAIPSVQAGGLPSRVSCRILPSVPVFCVVLQGALSNVNAVDECYPTCYPTDLVVGLMFLGSAVSWLS